MMDRGFLNQILENLQVGITILQADQVVLTNQKLLDIFGCTREAYQKDLGFSLSSRKVEPDLGQIVLLLKNKQPLPTMVEFSIRRADGKIRFLQNQYIVFKNQDTSSNLLIITTDITSRKLSTEALHRSEERYRQVSELTSDYAYSFKVSEDGTLLPEWFTEAFHRITGFNTPEEIDAFSGLISLIRQDDQSLVETYGENLISGKTNVYEFRIVAKNGELKWIRDYSQPIWDERKNRVVRILGAAQDVTKRKEAEEALIESEIRNQAILGAIPDWIFRIHRTGTILDFRGGRENSMTGLKDELIKKKVNDVFPQKSAELIEKQIEMVFDGQELKPFEFQWVFPDGVRYFEATLVRDGKNEVLLFSHDISERARLEKMKSDFINRASHELRTPLTGAILMSELIDMGGSKEEMDEYWDHLKGELSRQRSLVERLLTVGRLETGSLKLKPEEIELQPVLDEAKNTVYPLALTKSIEIITGIPGSLPLIMADRNALEQVFTNLLNNAVKFSDNGSKVHLTVAVNDENICVSIKDQGVGIPSSDLPHLFEGFFRAQNVIDKGIPGSGVGLYIVKNIIEEHGGKVTVNSKLNEGTEFEVSLPVYQKSNDITI